MSLITKASFLATTDSVSLGLPKTENHLTVATQASVLMSYNDPRLRADAVTVSEGLVLTFNMPLAPQQRSFTLFAAKLIPMPFPEDPQTTLTWYIGAPFIAPSEYKLESSVLPEEQFLHYRGSSK